MPLLTFIGVTAFSEPPAAPGERRYGALSLHPYTPADLGLTERWLAEPHLARFWLTGPGDRATRLARHRSRFIEAMEIDWLAPYTLRWAETDGAEPRRVGALLLRHVNAMPYWRSQATERETVGIDLFIGEAALTGRGLGRRAIALACRAAFCDQEVTCLIAEAAPRHAAAIAAFRAAGFVESGHAVTPSGPTLRLSRGRLSQTP